MMQIFSGKLYERISINNYVLGSRDLLIVPFIVCKIESTLSSTTFDRCGIFDPGIFPDDVIAGGGRTPFSLESMGWLLKVVGGCSSAMENE